MITMKSLTPPRICALAPLLWLGVLAGPGPCAGQPAPASPPPKEYSLFQGTDLAVSIKDTLSPVVDIEGGSWVVRQGGAQVVVSPKDGPVALKRKTGMRLTEASATVTGLKYEQAYTPGNDPYTKFTRATNQAAAEFAQSQFQANAANGMADMAAAAASRTNSASPSSAPVSDQGSSAVSSGLATAGAQVSAANAAAGATPGALLGTGQNPDDESYDALDISFEVSSRKLLERPYMVLLCRYHERNAPKGAVREWIYARALNAIGPEATKVSFLAGGFTPGYELQNFEVHLYNQGSEVATNLSPKRTEMTRDEAFAFVRRGYLGSHKGATLPAVASMGKLPADLPARLALGQFAQTLYVKVSAEGQVQGAYSDEACSRRIEDPYLAALLRDLCFEPALQGGEAVEGVAALNLGRLAM